MKSCITCKSVKPFVSFYKRESSKDGFRNECISCHKARLRKAYLQDANRIKEKSRLWKAENPDKRLINNRRWLAQNPEKMAESRKDWDDRHPEYKAVKKHRRRARMQDVEIQSISDRFIKNLYASSCVYCGAVERIEADHIIPISRGGAHCENNLQPLCKSCNSSKKDKTMAEWLSDKEKGM